MKVTIILAMLISLITTKNREEKMNNKEIIQAMYAQVHNQHDLSKLPLFISADYAGGKGPAEFAKVIGSVIAGFSDARWNVLMAVAEGDKVIVKQEFTGTNDGAFQQNPATGKKVTNVGMVTFSLKDGKVVDADIVSDRLVFLQALGLLPVKSKEDVCFIDRFLVPAAAKGEFLQRMAVNRAFIRKLDGFVEDAAYHYTDDAGGLVLVTTARWASKETLEKAKERVQQEYAREGFDMPGMLKRLNIKIERGVYAEL